MANVYVNDIIKRHPENQEQYVVEAIDIQGLFEYLKTHITLNNHELEVKDGKLNIVVDNETKTYTITFDYNGATYKGTQKLPTTTTSETISVQSGNQLGELPQNLIKKYTISWDKGSGTIAPTNGDTSVEHTLSGWYTLKTGGTQITSSTTVTGNQTYYARYTQATGTLNQPNNISQLKVTKNIKFYNGDNITNTIQGAVAYFKQWNPNNLNKASINGNTNFVAQYETQYHSQSGPQPLEDTTTQRFIGWATTEGGNPVNFERDSNNNYLYTSTEYYALWEPIPEQSTWYLGETEQESFTTDDFNQIGTKPTTLNIGASSGNTVTVWIYPQSWGKPTKILDPNGNDMTNGFLYGDDWMTVPADYYGAWVQTPVATEWTLTWD